MCLIFRAGKYDVSILGVQEELARRNRASKDKELICKKCDARLQSLGDNGKSICSIQSMSSTSYGKQGVSRSSGFVAEPTSLHICTCCHLEKGDRRKYIIFSIGRYNVNNPNVARAIEYHYMTPGQKELICRTCHALLLRDVLPQKALSSPTKDRPLPTSKCIVCDIFHDKKMRLFNHSVYGRNMKLDDVISRTEISINSIICITCHTKFLGVHWLPVSNVVLM